MAVFTDIGATDSGGSIRPKLNNLGHDMEIAFRVASQFSQLSTEIDFFVTNTIAFAESEGLYYYYNGSIWVEHPVLNQSVPALGEIYLYDGSTPQAISNGSTYIKVTGFATNGNSAGSVTPDVANDKITIARTGLYRVDGSFSFSSATGNININGAVFLNNVRQDNLIFQRKIGTSGDVGNANISGFMDVATQPLDVDFRVSHSGLSSVNMTFSFMNLNISRVANT